MESPVVIPPVVFERALQAGRSANANREAIGGLGAPLGWAILKKAAAIWDKVEAALVAAYRFGVDRAAELRTREMSWDDVLFGHPASTALATGEERPCSPTCST